VTPSGIVGELFAVLGSLDAGAVLVAISQVAVTGLVAVDLIAGRRAGRRVADVAQLRVAVTLGVGAAVLGGIYGAVVAEAYGQLAALVPWQSWMAQRPLVGFAVAVLAVDAATWAHHWLSHRTRWGWFCHRPHHTGDTFDATLALRQSWLPLPSLLVLPLVAVTGVPVTVALAAAATVALYGAATHLGSPVTVPRWFAAALITPDTHRRHHSDGSANLGAVLTLWDRLGGTWAGPAETAAPIGVHDGRTITGSLLERPLNVAPQLRHDRGPALSPGPRQERP
jgi:sterol desaturase/sphingolipid hydroxylase (fatty acid hydroxylase superfamily)